MCETPSVREEGKISVFLLDDHEVVRRGVHEMLSVEDDIEVVGEAGTAAGGVEVRREIRSGYDSVKCLMPTQ